MKHLTRSKDGIFYFQYWIPKQLSNSKYNGRIFKFSLRTTIRKDAIKQSYRLMGLILNLEERFKFNPNLYGDALTAMKTKLSKMNDDIESDARDFSAQLEHGFSIVEKLEEFEYLNNIPTSGNEEYQSQFNFSSFDKECYEIALRYIEENPTSEKSLNFNNRELQKLTDNIQEIKAVVAPTYTNEENPTLNTAFKIWQSEKKDFYATPKQFDTNYERIRLFIMFVGDDTRMDELTEDDVTEYKAFRKKLIKDTPIKDKSFDEIKENICHCGKCAVTGKGTLNDAFVSVGTFFGWCHEVGGHKYPINPNVKKWMNKRDKLTKKDKKHKKAFSDEQLKLLFNNIAYIKDAKFPISETTGKIVREWRFGKFSSSAMYWVQLISLFSGARQKEILQLERHDIYQDEESGIWIMYFRYDDIETDDENKHGKTESSDRIVPIHNQLKQLGFIQYVETIKKGSIFPDEPRDTESKIFKEYQDHYQWWRRKLGVKARKGVREKVDFHIFRGTVRTKLALKNVDSRLIDKILGHSGGDESAGDKAYTFTNFIELKYKVLNKLKYEAIDFDNMIRWNHCEFVKKESSKKK